MKKVENINLGNIKFVIDHDAYDKLENYLETIERHFKKSEGCEEIMEDIEIRMAELFQESLNNSGTIITKKNVDEVIVIMGTPEDFGAASSNHYTEAQDFGNHNRRYRGKRLFRDQDETVIAGVCSGLAAYCGISDPVIMRVIFVIATVVFGLPIIAYAVLWMITPIAKNANDKLAMKGEPINVENISKQVEDELYKLRDTLEEVGKSFSTKKKKMRIKRKSIAPFRNGYLL